MPENAEIWNHPPNIAPLEVHPAALAMPPLTVEQYESLRADIRAHGVREPAHLYDGMIIDGVHRARAARDAGQALPVWDRTDEIADPVSWVASLGLFRRHLSVSQRAIAAAELAKLSKKPLTELAKNAQVSRAQAYKAAEVAKDPELAEQVRTGGTTIGAAFAKRQREGQKQMAEAATARRAAAPQTAPAPQPGEMTRAEKIEARNRAARAALPLPSETPPPAPVDDSPYIDVPAEVPRERTTRIGNAELVERIKQQCSDLIDAGAHPAEMIDGGAMIMVPITAAEHLLEILEVPAVEALARCISGAAISAIECLSDAIDAQKGK